MTALNSSAQATIVNPLLPSKSNKLSVQRNHDNFVTELKNALDIISQNQIQAQNQAKALTIGEPNVSLNEVMVNLQKSSVSLQFGIQVRNKLVAAYQEIMNMNL